MKYYETACNEYVLANRQLDLHPELAQIAASMPAQLNQIGNMVFYGPCGVGKYTQFLRFVEKYSENRLKTEKMTSQTEKHTYTHHISDIHYEIDFALLGCESKKMWNECFFQIVDIISSKRAKTGIILCKNFHAIHSELLEVFYSYMQHCRALSIHIAFVLLTEHVSFIPNSILQCCQIIPVKRPSSQLYRQLDQYQTNHPTEEIGARCISLLKMANPRSFCLRELKESSPPLLPLRICALQNHHNDSQGSPCFAEHNGSAHNGSARDVPCLTPSSASPEFIPTAKIASELEPDQLLNLKEMRSLALVKSVEEIPKDVFNIVCDNIIRVMSQHKTIDIIDLRDNLYDILLYGIDITECLWYILNFFVENGVLVDDNGAVIGEILNRINLFLKYYNNNYRPIYHLESIFIYLITRIFNYPIYEPNART
jgi:hypothetical protein